MEAQETILPNLPKLNFEMAVIHWRGPYKKDELVTLSDKNGLYMATGCELARRTPTGRPRYKEECEILYFGITRNEIQKRLRSKTHPTVDQIKPDSVEYWVGQVVFPTPCEPHHLHLFEHILIWYWEPAINRNKLGPPKRSACIVNQWLYPDGSQRNRRTSVVKGLPDVIWFDKSRATENRMRIGDLKKWKALT